MVAKIEMGFSGQSENKCAEMIENVAFKMLDATGDGVETATVLAQAIYEEGLKLVAAGRDPVELKRGMDKAVDVVVAELKTLSRPSKNKKDIAQVGITAAKGDDTIGNMIADALEKVGKGGVITVELAKGLDTRLNVVVGMRFDRGFTSQYFVPVGERMEAVLENAYVLIGEEKISSIHDLLPLLESVARGSVSLLIIADDMADEVLSQLVTSSLRGVYKVAAVRAPGSVDQRDACLADIEVITGGQAVSEKIGLGYKNMTRDHLGRARRIIVGKDNTTIVDGGGEKTRIEAHLKDLRSQLEKTTNGSDREKLQVRLANLAGGVAVIHVGVSTETEMREKRARVESSLHAARAAVEEGIVPGGGVAYLRCLTALEKLKLGGELDFGVDIIKKALQKPLLKIASNAGLDDAVIINKVREGQGAFGYNTRTNVFEDLEKSGVIDPMKVKRTALQVAASMASELLIS